MKDSGVQWIGLIPDDWKIERLKGHFSFGKGLPITKADLIEKGSAVISYGQIHSKANTGVKIEESLKRFVSESFLKTNFYSLVNEGDFIFADTSEDVAGCGACVYVDKQQELFAGYHTIIARSLKKQNNKYFAYLFQTDNWRSQIREKVDGVKLFSTTQTILKQTYIILPPKDVQKKIADFLDKKCSEIQSAIDNTKQTIEEYKKLKQAVITKAVTKGIRENRKLKDSGIEWIGQIPEEWEVKRFGRVLNERSEKNNPVKCTERLSCSIDIGVTLYSEKTTNLDRFKDDFTQYKLAHVGDLVMNSMNVIVGSEGISAYYGCVSPAYYTYYDEVEDHYTARFCDYLLKTKGMKRLLFSLGRGIYAIERGDDRINTCRLKVPREDLKAIDIPVPDLSEQKEIVDYLDKYSKKIDTLISQKEQFITELEKYKQSLIYEYVTGKKEVK